MQAHKEWDFVDTFTDSELERYAIFDIAHASLSAMLARFLPLTRDCPPKVSICRKSVFVALQDAYVH